jgi:nitroreductase
MEHSEVVRRRRMVRAYSDRPLPEGTADRLVRAAVRAPSAGFSQGWGFLVLDAADDRARFWDAIDDEDWTYPPEIRIAPLVIVTLSNKSVYLERYAQPDKGWEDRSESHWPAPYWDIDTGMAALMILLGAVDMGLGALFFGFAPERIDPFRAAFEVPPEYHPIGAVTVGYAEADADPGGSTRTRRRRPVGDVVHHGRFGRPWADLEPSPGA